MKQSLVLLAALTATAATSFAQAPATSPPPAPAPAMAPSTTPDQQADRQAKRLTQELGLNADQQARLVPILAAQRQEMTAFRDKLSAGGRRAGLGQEFKAAQAKYDGQIKAVLTPEQYAKYDQLKDERRDKMREQRASGRALNGQ